MHQPNSTDQKGVTIIELTVVIAFLLTLTSILFLGAQYYKNAAERSSCIANLATIQKSVRSYQNFEGLTAGAPLTKSALIGVGKPMETELTCPSNKGGYTIASTIPSGSGVVAQCVEYDAVNGSVDSSKAHTPSNANGW